MCSEDKDYKDTNLYKIRHSLAHILAQAVVELRPGTTLGFGPAISDGFYYDFILSAPLSEEDFASIEKSMKKIIKRKQKFEMEELPIVEAFAKLDELNEPYKKEYAQELCIKNNLSTLKFYTNGSFIDMCEGPHVEHTKQIQPGSFKLRNIAGAYWRGDSDNVQMTRIYAWAFETKEELVEHVTKWKDAQERDHKKLGRKLEIFYQDNDIGAGLPLWLPNGTIIRDELEKLAKELEV